MNNDDTPAIHQSTQQKVFQAADDWLFAGKVRDINVRDIRSAIGVGSSNTINAALNAWADDIAIRLRESEAEKQAILDLPQELIHPLREALAAIRSYAGKEAEKAFDEEREQAQQQVEAAEQARTATEQQNEAISTENERLEQRLQEHQAQIATKDDLIVQLRQQLEERTQQLDVAIAKEKDAIDHVRAMQDKLTQQENYQRDAEANWLRRLDEETKRSRELDADKKRVEGELSKATKAIRTLETEFESKLADIVKLQTQLEHLSSSLDDNMTKLDVKDAKIRDLEQQNQRLEVRAERTEAKLETRVLDIGDLKELLRKEQEQVVRLNGLVSENQARIKELEECEPQTI